MKFIDHICSPVCGAELYVSRIKRWVVRNNDPLIGGAVVRLWMSGSDTMGAPDLSYAVNEGRTMKVNGADVPVAYVELSETSSMAIEVGLRAGDNTTLRLDRDAVLRHLPTLRTIPSKPKMPMTPIGRLNAIRNSK